MALDRDAFNKLFSDDKSEEPRESAKTVQEMIELLGQVKDKSQVIHVWDRYGYYGTDLILVVADDQAAKPLMIESK